MLPAVILQCLLWHAHWQHAMLFKQCMCSTKRSPSLAFQRNDTHEPASAGSHYSCCHITSTLLHTVDTVTHAADTNATAIDSIARMQARNMVLPMEDFPTSLSF